jgi:Putative peptidoglycan binding domain
MATKLETFTSPRFTGKIVLADVEFLDSLQKIDQFAQANNLEIFVTSSARQQGVPIGGTIVLPASRSNHLVGHGIDMNIMLRGKLYNSDDLGDFNTLPTEIKQFITSVRNDSIIRWGGDFDAPDPVHLDDGLNVREPATWKAKFPIIQFALIDLSQPNTPPGQPRLLQLTQPFLKGNDVLILQRALIKLGFNIDDDGVFGNATDAAITAFQQSNGLTPDGIVGSKTRKVLGI